MGVRIVALWTLLVCGAACSTLTPDGRKVRFTGQVLPECKFLGATDAMESVLFAEGNLENVLRNQAAQMGGDWVVVTRHTSHKPSAGDVYKCPEGAYNIRGSDSTINLKVSGEK